MHVNYDSSIIVGMKGYGLDVRVKNFPLPGPIVAYRFMTVNVATLPSIGPFHVGVHGTKNSINVAGVEVGIGLYEERISGHTIMVSPPGALVPGGDRNHPGYS
jgi:hypothetical protein